MSAKMISFKKSIKPQMKCPNCDGKGLWVFYAVSDIPVHSCLLMSSRKEAIDYPKGDLELGFCKRCGFVTNTCFDPTVHHYSSRYEETQGFSAHFNSFAKSLAQRIIDRFNIRGKTVLEIGCGKGEFLALMCQFGGNRGIGIDPAFVPERNPAVLGTQINFIKDFYSQKYADLRADVVCCRHTLEHIPNTLEFMRLVRQAISEQSETLVFFELPDVMRVLKDGAFWDIYYEHCSYFTTGSLARPFRATGFEIEELYLDYNGQYIILTAYPSVGPTVRKLEIEDDLGEIVEAVESFQRICHERIQYWQKMIAEFVGRGQRTVIWGAGSKGVAFLTTLGLCEQIEYLVDVNPYKQGKFIPGTGQEVVSPDFLREYKPQKIIVMNPVYCNEIRNRLDSLGVKADLLAV